MNSNQIQLPATLLTAILLILAAFSCQKDPYQIGKALLPATDTLNVKTTDTCTVEAFSVLQDSVRSDKSGSLVLGSMMDPVFGKITTSFYAQLLLSSEGVDFGKHPVLDSIVLMLFYNGHAGDTLTKQNLKVYEISQSFPYDSVHYSGHHLNTYPTLLADQDYIPKLSDSVSVGGTKVAPHLRVNLGKLTNYLGNKILYAPATSLATNTAFINYIKGLYVQATPVNGNGALINYSITNGQSKVVAYYHNGDLASDDSLHYDIVISESSARFLHIDHNGYIDASQELKQQILGHDSVQGDRHLFLQGMGGVKVKVKFPYLKYFGKGKAISNNSAILEMQNVETDTTYKPPSSLLLLRQDSIGRIGHLADENEGSGYFGGTYDRTSRTYYFRLTQHMQKILLNTYSNKFDLYLMVNSPITSSLSANRIMLKGPKPLLPGDHASRFRLKVTYTILH